MNRRNFLQSAAAATAMLSGRPAFGSAPPVLLDLRTRTIEVNGKPASVLGITQPNGTRGLSIDVSQPFRVEVRNGLDRISLIHWHGLTPPWRQDGVPYVSAPPIPAGGSASYDFKLTFAGTFWMHSHVGFQEQELLAAPLIIHEPKSADLQEAVVMLEDFTFRDPKEIFAALRASGKPVVQGQKPDLNDVDYDAFLANDRTLSDPAIVSVEPGASVRLRLINGSAATNYWISLGGLRGRLIAVDGSPVRPLPISTMPLAVAQRADIVIDVPRGAGAYPILAQVEGKRDRTGFVLRTPGASVARIASQAERESPAVGFAFERGLRAKEPLKPLRPQIVREVPLTGDMRKYVWMMDNQVYPNITPILISAEKRVLLVMRNQTMMSHPMHLHGHRFQVVGLDGRWFAGAVRDTVLVPPKRTVAITFDANNPGRWAFHCHNLYHLAAGMMTVVDYEGVPMPQTLDPA
jgi:FtsP/CotA-like multicopper oxidase with cupredoxin domain